MINMTHGTVKIFAGNGCPDLAKAIADRLELPLGQLEATRFSDGEICVNIKETVRGCDVFVVQSTSTPVNDNLMELLVMIDAFKRASCNKLTVVMPYFGYARQDRKARARDPITAKLVANLLEKAGADRVLTMDLHSTQLQGFFDIPVDNLLGDCISRCGQRDAQPFHGGEIQRSFGNHRQASSQSKRHGGHEHHRRRKGQGVPYA